MIQRPQYEGVHSGQIALPGGKYEDADKDLIATAIRETQEEVGADPNTIEVIGHLSEFMVSASNHLVTKQFFDDNYQNSLNNDNSLTESELKKDFHQEEIKDEHQEQNHQEKLENQNFDQISNTNISNTSAAIENTNTTESAGLFDALDTHNQTESVSSEDKIEKSEPILDNGPELEENKENAVSENEEFTPESEFNDKDLNQDLEDEELLDIPTFLRRQAN